MAYFKIITCREHLLDYVLKCSFCSFCFRAVFFATSAICLLVFSQKINASIRTFTALVAGNKERSKSSPPIVSSLQKHSLRIYWSSYALALSYLLRAASWSVSVFDTSNDIDNSSSPWFYPLCFYQIPMFFTSIAVMCIVGNADIRFWALLVWCFNSDSKNRDSVSPVSPKLRVSYNAGPGGLDEKNEGDVDLTQVYPPTRRNSGAVTAVETSDL